jgi:two-component system, OmpR family, KDP operon response regulator KdpE
MTAVPTVLAVDDEQSILRLLEITLRAQGFHVVCTKTGAEALVQAATARPDIVVLDLGLPDAEGIDVLRRIREWSAIPVIILSARSSEQEIVRCLDAGADDYLVKPFRTAELAARVRAALRRPSPSAQSSTLSFGSVTIDFSGHRVEKNSEVVHLTAIEYAVFSLMAQNAGRILTHGQILQKVWGPTFAEETQYLRVYIAQLRKKLEEDPANPRLLVTETGIGYRLNENPAQLR